MDNPIHEPAKRTIVTLTTDWGYRDFFAGRVKGKLYSYIPNVEVVDITHGIDAYQLTKAIFVVRQACLDFPPGTIHIIDVKGSDSSDSSYVAVEYRQQYYLCTDNQLPHAVFGDDPSLEGHVVDINVPLESNCLTFSASELFCKVAAMIAQGAKLSDIGHPYTLRNRHVRYNNTPLPDGIKTHIAYIDNYGNAYLNITFDEFEQERNGRDFTVQVRESTLTKISHSYLDTSASGTRAALLLLVSSTGLLEVAIREGSAEQLFDLHALQTLPIRFKDKDQR